MRWNSIIAAFFLVVWIAMFPCILFPDVGPISQVNAFIISITSFPLFAFYAARYDEKVIIPLNYLPNAYSHARHSLEFDGVVLFIGRLFILGFMALLMGAAILLGFLNAGYAANDIAIYAFYSLVLGVALTALSSWGRRELTLGGNRVERGSLDLRLSSSYRFLRVVITVARERMRTPTLVTRETTEEVLAEMVTKSEISAMKDELLNSIQEIQRRLDTMQRSSDTKIEEIRRRLDRIEKKLDRQTE